MNVLSLFDGLSAAHIALKKLNIKCNYFSSEIDKWALAVSQYNFTQTRLGDITKVNFSNLPKIDLVIGGPPCQDLSIAKYNRSGLQGQKSNLFWYFADVIKALQPKYFICENVASMKESSKNLISQELGCEPIMINSALLSAQTRKRYYWCNFKVEQPQETIILLDHIITSGRADRDKAYCLDASYHKGPCSDPYYASGRRQMVMEGNGWRMLTPIECERLQTIPDDYTKIGVFDGVQKEISNTQRYKMLGNSFTVEVIKHILRYI